MVCFNIKYGKNRTIFPFRFSDTQFADLSRRPTAFPPGFFAGVCAGLVFPGWRRCQSARSARMRPVRGLDVGLRRIFRGGHML